MSWSVGHKTARDPESGAPVHYRVSGILDDGTLEGEEPGVIAVVVAEDLNMFAPLRESDVREVRD